MLETDNVEFVLRFANGESSCISRQTPSYELCAKSLVHEPHAKSFGAPVKRSAAFGDLQVACKPFVDLWHELPRVPEIGRDAPPSPPESGRPNFNG